LLDSLLKRKDCIKMEILIQQANKFYTKFKELTQLPENADNYQDRKNNLGAAVGYFKDALEFAKKNKDHTAGRKVARNLLVAYRYQAPLLWQKGRLEVYYEAAAAFEVAVVMADGDQQWINPGKGRKGLWDLMRGLIEDMFMWLPDLGVDEEELVRLGQCFVSKLNRWSGKTEMNNAIVLSRLLQGEGLLNRVIEAVSNRKYPEALYLLSEMYTVVEEALFHLPKSSLAELVRPDLNVLQEDVRVHRLLAEALKCLDEGDALLKEATEGGETLNLDLVFDSVDKYRLAISLICGEDVEINCMANTAIAKVYLKVFKDGIHKTRAKEYLQEVTDLSATLERGNLYNYDWYKQATAMQLELQEEVKRAEEQKWENQRKTFLEQLKEEMEELENKYDTEDMEFVKFVLDKYPPKHRPELEWKKFQNVQSTDGSREKKKAMMKLVTIYHPDRIQADVHGQKYLVLCEEINKDLTRRYNSIKGCPAPDSPRKEESPDKPDEGSQEDNSAGGDDNASAADSGDDDKNGSTADSSNDDCDNDNGSAADSSNDDGDNDNGSAADSSNDDGDNDNGSAADSSNEDGDNDNGAAADSSSDDYGFSFASPADSSDDSYSGDEYKDGTDDSSSSSDDIMAFREHWTYCKDNDFSPRNNKAAPAQTLPESPAMSTRSKRKVQSNRGGSAKKKSKKN